MAAAVPRSLLETMQQQFYCYPEKQVTQTDRLKSEYKERSNDGGSIT